MEKEGDDIYVSMTIPGLIIGTVGGATQLPAQQQLLKTLGCEGDGKVFRFAEIIAGFCLALDLSTMSAMVSDVFASAHARLARRPTKAIFLRKRR
jgi:hydroxymethylglutaryl-CoA reductase (NADPH)